jgi:DNA-binding CsgD family transcriptional regulator
MKLETKNFMPAPIQLSVRETEVLMWTACGKTCEEISDFLFLSKETIRAQIKSACKKLNANNKTQATAIALIHGILPFGPSPKRVIPLTTLFGLSRGQAVARPVSQLPRRPVQKKP